MAQIFAAFGKSLGNNKGSVQNFGIVGVTIASEEITKFIFFFCPCDYPDNKVYGSIFIWGPAAVLFIVGYLVNRRTWRLTTGLCNRTQGVGKGGKRIFHFIFIFMSIGVKALIAPATWVVLAFLKGDYYACARWPNPDNPAERAHFNLAASNASLPRPCMFNPNPVKFDASEAEVIARNLRAESHVIGWFYLCIGMFMGVVTMFLFRCRSKYSYEQSNYIDRYRQSEVKLFEDELESKAEEQAQRIVKGYFSKPRAKEEWDQIAVINDKVTRSKRGRAIYSPLHKFVNRELRAAEDATQDVGLVSDAAMKIKRPLLGKKKKPANNVGGGGSAPAAIPMVPMGGGSKKTVLKTQKPVEMKGGTFEEANKQQKPAEEKPAQPKPDKEIVPEIQVVDPSKPATSAATGAQIAPQPTVVAPQPIVVVPQPTPPDVPPAIPPPPQKQDLVAPPYDKPRAPTPVEEPVEEATEKRPAVRETSLGDFGGTYSREDLRVPDDEDEDPVPMGDKVIRFEEIEEEAGDDGMEQVDGGQENGIAMQAEDDEQPLLSED